MKFYIDGKHRHSSQMIKALEVEADDREEAISIAIERGVVISWVGRDPEVPRERVEPLETEPPPEKPQTEPVMPPLPPPVRRPYTALKSLAILLDVTALITLVGSILVILFAGYGAWTEWSSGSGESLTGLLYAVGIALLAAIFGTTFFLAMAQMCRVMIHLESNTRQVAEMMQRLAMARGPAKRKARSSDPNERV